MIGVCGQRGQEVRIEQMGARRLNDKHSIDLCTIEQLQPRLDEWPRSRKLHVTAVVRKEPCSSVPALCFGFLPVGGCIVSERVGHKGICDCFLVDYMKLFWQDRFINFLCRTLRQ